MNAAAASSSHAPAVAVRAEILAQHQALRRHLQDTARLADRILDGDELAVATMIGAWDALRGDLERHMAFEETVLGPLLATLDPHSPEHAHYLVAEHRRQRQDLGHLTTLDPEAEDMRFVARAVLAFITELLDDMRIEERTLLGPEVLQDEIVTANQETD
jgi:iron-sulfur cluster repair protein YtfE (RIC family)